MTDECQSTSAHRDGASMKDQIPLMVEQQGDDLIVEEVDEDLIGHVGHWSAGYPPVMEQLEVRLISKSYGEAYFPAIK